MVAQENAIGWASALVLMIGVSVVMIAAGLLIVGIAARSADGRLGRNGWAGVRTRTTRSSDEAWLAAHQAAEHATTLGGWAMIATSVAGLVLGLAVGRNDAELATLVWAIVVSAGAALLVTLVVYGAWKGQQAAKRTQEH